MNRFGSSSIAIVMFVVGTVLFAGGLAPTSLAATPADRSEVVLVFDLSASILKDKTNRGRFAAALDRIADRVDQTSADLVAGDATVSIVQFASKATDYAGCVDLKLIGSPPTVARFAVCLRNLAKAYRKGLDPALTRKIGVDTNYVAAMERAAVHLPLDAVRPALILFTDGKHDVAGVPVGQVLPARDRLFASRSPFAFLPVGMGLSSKERPALERGLVNLRTIREMPACVSGAVFDWPQVVFESANEAGNAVAVALQDVTCTFTVAPTPSPSGSPTPTPEPTLGPVRNIKLTPTAGRIKVTWVGPAIRPTPVVDYRVRCRAGEGEWTESNEGVSLEPAAVIDGLTNGIEYRCEVAADDATSVGPWVAGPEPATPLERPAAPAKPSVEALDGAVRISLAAVDASLVSDYRYECSSDNGGSWPIKTTVASSPGLAAGAATEIRNLTNGVGYVCRAYAARGSDVSDPSALSDAFKPCGSALECNPILAPILGVLGALMIGGLLAAVFAVYRNRPRGYVVAVVDVVHTVNLGHGSTLGIAFIRDPQGGRVIGIEADRSPSAEIRIRYQGKDRFEVTDAAGNHAAEAGRPVIVVDRGRARHEIVLRAFRTATASPVKSGR